MSLLTAPVRRLPPRQQPVRGTPRGYRGPARLAGYEAEVPVRTDSLGHILVAPLTARVLTQLIPDVFSFSGPHFTVTWASQAAAVQPSPTEEWDLTGLPWQFPARKRR